MSDVSGPPETDDEQRRITSTLHALDHATLLAEIAGEARPENLRVAELCADAMQNAAAIAGEVAGKSAAPDRTASIETRRKSAGSPEVGVAVDAPAALIG